MGRKDKKDEKGAARRRSNEQREEAWRRVKFVLFVVEMWWIEIIFVAKM
jgi:hypothetical protein